MRLERTGGRTRVGLLVDFDADVKVVADALLLFVVAPVLARRLQRSVPAQSTAVSEFFSVAEIRRQHH